tara:strand:- start:390 stop:1016 length:627 start_codon:yes stop_codon:yes gene_type:complete
MALGINGSSNTITGLAVGGLPDGVVDTDMLAANAVTAAKRGSGAILQVVSTNITTNSSVSVSSDSFSDTPASVTITSVAANSKFLISALVSGEGSIEDHQIGFALRRVIGGSTSLVAVGDSSDNRPQLSFMQNVGYRSPDNSTTPSTSTLSPYLDSPSQAAGTAITYKISVYGIASGLTYYFGRVLNDADVASRERLPNYITVMEVAV